MHSAVIIWLVIFALSTILFFAIAAVVIVRGFSDLRSLLRMSRPDGDAGSETDLEGDLE
jgi:hypothetical protein